MKRYLTIPFMLASCICLVLSGCETKENKPLHPVKEQSIEDAITSVRVNWISGDIQILKSEDNHIRIVQSATNDIPEKNRFTASVENGTLTVTDNRKIDLGFLFSTSANLELYCPDKYFDSISLSCTSGTIDGGDLQAKSLDAESTSADIDVGGTFETVNLKSVSGTMKGKNLQAKSLNARSTSGDIDVNGAIETISFSNTSGRIQGEALQTKSLDAGSISGDIDVSGAFETINLKSVSGDPKISCSQTPKTITAATTSGNVVLNLPQNDGFALSFHSTSGKLKSDFALQQNGEDHIYKNDGNKITVNTTSGDLAVHPMSQVNIAAHTFKPQGSPWARPL